MDEEKTKSMEQPEMVPEGATAGAAETERAAGEAPAIEPATAPEAATEQKSSKKSAIIIVIALVAVVALGSQERVEDGCPWLPSTAWTLPSYHFMSQKVCHRPKEGAGWLGPPRSAGG